MINVIDVYKANGMGLCPNSYTVPNLFGERRNFLSYEDSEISTNILNEANKRYPNLLFKVKFL